MALPLDYEVEDPYKAKVSPLRMMPSCDTPLWIMADPAHTWAISGFGKDFCASSIIVLVRLGIFGRGGLQKRLNEGFCRFKQWCKDAGKTTSMTEFSLKAFKVSTFLGLDIACFYIVANGSGT